MLIDCILMYERQKLGNYQQKHNTDSSSTNKMEMKGVETSYPYNN